MDQISSQHTHVAPCTPVVTARGFTLAEILVVVVILSVLAAMAASKFISTFDDTREKTIQVNVHRIRSQLDVYRQQHGAYPTAAGFVDQMTLASDSDGNTAPPGTPGFKLGPYIRRIPVNPNSGGTTVGNGAVGTSDWYYDQAGGAFHANDSAQSRAY